MNWTVDITKKAQKQLRKLPEHVQLVTQLLVEDLKLSGPVPSKGWSHYGKLRIMTGRDLRHCHLIKGRPTYVACWELIDKSIKLIEVYYVGTHENAPY